MKSVEGGYSPNKWYHSDGRIVWRHVQVDQPQILSVEVKNEGDACVQRPLAAGAVQREKVRQDRCIDLGSVAFRGGSVHKVFYRHDSIQQLWRRNISRRPVEEDRCHV